jgi:hypothetical protein
VEAVFEKGRVLGRFTIFVTVESGGGEGDKGCSTNDSFGAGNELIESVAWVKITNMLKGAIGSMKDDVTWT